MSQSTQLLQGGRGGRSWVPRPSAASAPRRCRRRSSSRRPPCSRRRRRPTGRPYQPIVTLNGWSLPWRMKDGVKEFHLVAEPVVREIAPGMTATCGATTAKPGADHRGGGGRPHPHLRDQQAARGHQRALARRAAAVGHGRRDRPVPAAHRRGQDLPVRVRAAAPRHLHVPPARGRDGADGHGHDGPVHRPPEGPRAGSRSTATSASS